MIGTCGTCGRDAEATQSNEGYSDCCNDRIEYGDEAAETRAHVNCDHAVTKTERVTYIGLGPEFKRTTVTETVCANCGTHIDNEGGQS